MRGLLTLILMLSITACAWQKRMELDRAYGPEQARNRIASGIPPVDYWREVKPILDSRCAVCHGCYDAPCQLNLTAFEGADRGANKNKVYDGTRLLAANLTRLFDDARSTAGWRQKGFFPVFNEREQTGPANLAGGVMARMLQLKHDHPLPRGPLLDDSFDLALDRDQQCPAIEEFDRFADNYPSWGMPYGLPGLDRKEHTTLMRWLEAGSPYTEPSAPPAELTATVARWEQFLNGHSPKERLMSRYLYEHLFLGDLYFDDVGPGHYFRMVRSRTAPGRPIDLIATRRPYDDPGVSRVYYRLQPLRTTVLSKTHQPYALGEKRMKRYRELFLDAPFQVAQLPSYQPEVASNPFVAFHDLPVRTRYRFLLDDAQYIVMGFIKGPVCRGQVALNVIDDRFWTFFLAPEISEIFDDADFLAEQSSNLRLPSEEQSNALAISTWVRYSQLQDAYLAAKASRLKRVFARRDDITLSRVWDGDGSNPNAGLTIFRHFDSASVVQGLVGGPPKTAWVIGYPLLERIHYLLVAGFDVYGNYGHQLNSRLYMDFLRMEGEFNFLVLLPKEVRRQLRDHWYRGASDTVKNYLFGSRLDFDQQTGIPYATRDPKTELFEMLRTRLGPALNRSFDLTGEGDPFIREQMTRLASARGRSVSWLAQNSFVAVTDSSRPDDSSGWRIYSMLEDSARSNISHLLSEQQSRLPDEDQLTVARGFIGAYPNAFMRVEREQLSRFVDAVRGLASEADYARLLDRYGIRRTDRRFWPHSDRMHQKFRDLAPLEAGLFDYNRLENR